MNDSHNAKTSTADIVMMDYEKVENITTCYSRNATVTLTTAAFLIGMVIIPTVRIVSRAVCRLDDRLRYSRSKCSDE